MGLPDPRCSGLVSAARPVAGARNSSSIGRRFGALARDRWRINIHREGNRLVIEPVERISLLDVIATWEPLDIEFPELADEKPDAVEL